MRVECLLAAIVLSLATAGCGDDSGNVMAPNANILDPAIIDAALGPEPGGEPDSNLLSANEAAEVPVATNRAPASTPDDGEPPARDETAAEPAAGAGNDVATEEVNAAAE